MFAILNSEHVIICYSELVAALASRYWWGTNASQVGHRPHLAPPSRRLCSELNQKQDTFEKEI